MSAVFPARLHVLLARACDRAVVLRRGPSDSVASFLWDRRHDSFILGQWLRGRIYERRADLSPDGGHLIYFATNARGGSGTGVAWTAISRAPWLKARALWGKGDRREGGGLFLDDRRYWLNGPHRPMAAERQLERLEGDGPDGGFGSGCAGVYYPRLLRDGWRLAAPAAGAHAVDRFEKPLRHGWTLVKLANRPVSGPPGRDRCRDEHLLAHARRAAVACSDWEWAETDPAGVVFARAGCLWRQPINRHGPAEPQLLRDFNADRFEAVAAPY
jgi:hypothetical protein